MLNEHIEKQNDIITGSMKIDSIEEFKKILGTSPDNPALLKIYADLLVQKKIFDEAAGNYKKASTLFIESGMILKAMASRIQEWDLIKSSGRECRSIYFALHEIKSEETPVYDLFARMTYPELVTIMEESEIIHLPAGATVIAPGDEENNIYFVVSGTLTEKPGYLSERSKSGDDKSIEKLVENQFFGDIYPYEEERLSHSAIETLTEVDLIKIAKSDVIWICRKYPNVEFLIMELCDTRSESGGKKSSRIIRATERYQLQTKVTLKIFPDEDNQNPLILNGFTDDMSLGGACIRLGEKYWTGSLADMIGKNVKILINVPKVSADLNVFGKIIWKRETSYEGEKTILIGVEFRELTGEDLEFLKKHSYIGEGEEEMIYSLWESFVKK
jgi:hypothetical protein